MYEPFSKNKVPLRRYKTEDGKYVYRSSHVECNGQKFSYRAGRHKKQGHAEAKMIEQIFRQAYPNRPQGTLYLAVLGREICSDCWELLMCAAESIRIVICTELDIRDKSGKHRDRKKPGK